MRATRTSTHLFLILAASLMLSVRLLLLPVTLAGQGAPVVTASGQGEASVAPDRAVVDLAVETHLRTARQASDSLATLLERIRGNIAAAGISRDSVATRYFTVTPVYRMTSDNRRLADGYRARMHLEVPVNDLSGVGGVIDAIIGTDGTSLSGVRFESTHRESVRAAAIAQAVHRAEADARALADAAGLALGQLIELTTEGSATPIQFRSMAMDRMESAPELTPQDIVVTVHVVGRWSLTDRP